LEIERPLVDFAMPVDQPLVFEPIFMERVWGGRRLESLFGKRLPAGARIGESWEIVDRSEAQSVVHDGALRGETLHELWMNRRAEIFGDVPDASRFPILIKLLDAREKLSVQVHPPIDAAEELGGEAKSEFWYIAEAGPAAELYVGLTSESSPAKFADAIQQGTVEEHVHRITVSAGDCMFLPSGRVHAIGAGNVIVEIQQNSDTTYRVFDWNRGDRELHIDESLRCIDFDDVEPSLTEPEGESLVRHEVFHVEKWQLENARVASEQDRFAIICCIAGAMRCGDVQLTAGNFALIPACLPHVMVQPTTEGTELLRVTTPA
jgi:mannose-6-phosphate isomerase